MASTIAFVLSSGAAEWKSVGGQLLASGVLLLSGHQDIGLRARVGAVFGFLMAIAFGISALVTEMRTRGRCGRQRCGQSSRLLHGVRKRERTAVRIPYLRDREIA